MSSPKTARAKSAHHAKPSAARKGTRAEISPVSANALRLAAEIERGLSKGRLDALTADALHALTAAACKAYAARIEAGGDLLPLGPRSGVTPTDVMTVSSGLLRSVNLAVFELGMWQSWTGR